MLKFWDRESRSSRRRFRGVWIYEIAELDGIRKAQVTEVKLFASKDA